MIRMDLAELYTENHRKSNEKRITVEFIYGKSFFKNEIINEKKQDTILNMIKKANQDPQKVVSTSDGHPCCPALDASLQGEY